MEENSTLTLNASQLGPLWGIQESLRLQTGGVVRWGTVPTAQRGTLSRYDFGANDLPQESGMVQGTSQEVSGVESTRYILAGAIRPPDGYKLGIVAEDGKLIEIPREQEPGRVIFFRELDTKQEETPPPLDDETLAPVATTVVSEDEPGFFERIGKRVGRGIDAVPKKIAPAYSRVQGGIQNSLEKTKEFFSLKSLRKKIEQSMEGVFGFLALFVAPFVLMYQNFKNRENISLIEDSLHEVSFLSPSFVLSLFENFT